MKKIGVTQIDNFSLSNDGKMLTIYSTYMVAVAEIGTIDRLFDPTFEVEGIL